MDKFSAQILFEDNHLLVINKKAGQLSQPDGSPRPDLKSLARDYLKQKYGKPGDAFVGIVHRLDRPVTGVVILAKTSKATSRLNESQRLGQWEKRYRLAVPGILPESGTWKDKLVKKDGKAVIAPEDGKMSELSFQRLKTAGNISLAEVFLVTGRYHQIRAQFSSRGFPVWGDSDYGFDGAARQATQKEKPNKKIDDSRKIALHCHSIKIPHPVTKEMTRFTAPIPDSFPIR